MTSRILFVTQTAYAGGGIEEWLWSLYTELESAGWDCSVGLVKGARFHRPDEYLKTYPFGNHFDIDGSDGYVEQRHESLAQAFESCDPELIVCFNLADVLYAAVNWKVRRKQNVRIVYAVHSLAPQVLNDVKCCAANIDLVACVSKRACQLLRDLCAPQSPVIEHLPTGVSASVRKTLWNDEPFIAGYVGRLDPTEKRIMDLIDLVRTTRSDVRFEIAGQGAAEATLKKELAPFIDAGRVVFHGQLDRDQLDDKIYSRLQALLLFSPAEGGPIVAWEAMRHGVVPIVSDFQGREEEGVIRHNENAMVFPVGDMNQAAEALASLRAEPSRWEALSKQAADIPNIYHQETFGIRWADALRQTLSRSVRIDCTAQVTFASPGRLAFIIRSPHMRLVMWKAVGRKFIHSDAGGEWPHSYNGQVNGE